MIPREQLSLRTGNAGFRFGPPHGAILGWEVYNPLAVVASGTLSRKVAVLNRLEAAGKELIARAEGEYEDVVMRHEANQAIGGFSAFDADLILDSWWFGEVMVHPLCGEHAWEGGEGFVARVNRVLEICLPPPTWFWAESVNPGELRVKCVAVPDAGSYNVYDGEELLGNVPNHNWNTLLIPSGQYQVRMAAVKDSQVGVPSFLVYVGQGGHTDGSAVAPRVSAKKGVIRRFLDWLST